MLLRNKKETAPTADSPPTPKSGSFPTNPDTDACGESYWASSEEYYTLPPIEETLLDIHPGSLDEPFYWCYQVGSTCWVKVPEGDCAGCEQHWQMGTIDAESMERVICDQGILRQYVVGTVIEGKRVQYTIATGLKPDLLPDTPQVRDLLRRYGYDVVS